MSELTFSIAIRSSYEDGKIVQVKYGINIKTGRCKKKFKYRVFINSFSALVYSCAKKCLFLN